MMRLKKTLWIIGLAMVVVTACGSGSRLDNEILSVINENLRASRSENMDAYLATMHEDAPLYDETVQQVALLFNSYDLTYELEELEVVEKNASEAKVWFVQITRKLSGPEFNNNKVTGYHILKKSGNKWKMYKTLIKNIEYLA